MIQRFLFNRIDTKAAAAAIGRYDNAIIHTLPYKTKAALSFVQLTKSRTKPAFDTTIRQHHPLAALAIRLYWWRYHQIGAKYSIPSPIQNQAGKCPPDKPTVTPVQTT